MIVERVVSERMTKEQMADLAKRLEKLDPALYNQVLAMAQESAILAVEEYKRESAKNNKGRLKLV